MDGSSWDFNAPTTFIDFASGEHLRNTGIDENYFSYDHEKSPPVDKSMEFKPSGLSDITNKSRLTFDSPAKATPKTPVIKTMKTNLQDQNGNHKVMKIRSHHQGAGDGPEMKIEADMKPLSQESADTKVEEMDAIENVVSPEADADAHMSSQCEQRDVANSTDNNETNTDVRMPNEDEQGDSAVSIGDEVTNDMIQMSNQTECTAAIKRADDITNTQVDILNEDNETDTVDNSDNNGANVESHVSSSETENHLSPRLDENSSGKQTDIVNPPNETIATELESKDGDAAKDEVGSSQDNVPMEFGEEQISLTEDGVDAKEEPEPEANSTTETRCKEVAVDAAKMHVDSTEEKSEKDTGTRTPRNATPVARNHRQRSSQTKYGNLRSQALHKQRLQRSGKITTPVSKLDPDAPPLKKLKGTGSASCRKSAKVPLRSVSRQVTPSTRWATPKDGSVKSHSMERRSARSTEVDFVKGLRQYPVSQKKLTPTVAKPFHFSSDRKRKLDFDGKNKNETYNFEKAAKAGVKKGPIKIKPALTVPRTPNLRSRTRKRPPSVVSAQEMEEKEIEEMKNYHFKARPANQKMLREPSPLPDVEKPSTTETEEFHFSTDKRLQDKKKMERPPSPCRDFKAKPVPKGIFKPPMIEPAKIQRKIHEKIVKPKSPGPKPAQEKRTNTKVMPFSFYERDMERLAKKEEKIKMIHEAERAVELEEEALREKRNFKANETYKDSLHRPGWRPKLEGKHTEVFEEFTLHSKSRASQRQDFDDQLKRKEAHIMALMEEKKREEERQQEEEAKEMRKKAEFKANPVRKYKKLEITGSDKMPTLPESPNFSDRFYKKLPEKPDNGN